MDTKDNHAQITYAKLEIGNAKKKSIRKLTPSYFPF